MWLLVVKMLSCRRDGLNFEKMANEMGINQITSREDPASETYDVFGLAFPFNRI